MKHNNSNKNENQNGLYLIPQSIIDSIKEDQQKILELLSNSSSNQNLGNYISEFDAKKLLGRQTTWFWGMRTSGQLMFTKIGNKIFYSKEDIIKLLDENKTSTKSIGK